MYEVTTNVLVSSDGPADDIIILYKGQPVPEIRSTQIKIWNGGSEAIRRDDIAKSKPLVVHPS